MDQSRIAHLTMELMDDLEQHFGEGTQIGAVCLVVEATGADGETAVVTKSFGASHVVLGMLEVAKNATMPR